MVDRWTVRIIAGGLLLIAVVVVTGSFWLTDHGREIPVELIAIGSAALGGLSTFLVSTRGGTEPAPVRVDNATSDPVPVAEVPKAARAQVVPSPS